MSEIRELTADELDDLKNQGVDTSSYIGKKFELTPRGQPYQDQIAPTRQPYSTLGTVGKTLEAHAGRTLGGGSGAIGGAELAEMTPFAHIAPPWSEVGAAAIGGTLGALGMGYVGEEGQHAVMGDEAYNNLQLEQQASAQDNPLTAGGTDILSSMLASGGKPSLSVLPRAIGGDVNATRSIIANSLINPAINTGVDYLRTGQLPSAGDLAAQVGSGLVTDSAKWAQRLTGKLPAEVPQTQTTETSQPEGPQQGPTSPYLHTLEDGTPFIDDANVKKAFKEQLNPKPDYDSLNTSEDKYAARTAYERANKQDVDTMRQQLHDKWMENKQTDTPITQQPIVKIPDNAIPPTKVEPTTQTVETQPPVEENSNLTNLGDRSNEFKNEDVNEDNIKKNAPLSDKEQYDSLLSKAKEMMSNGQTNTPEFRDLWQQMENVKNNNSGNTPITNNLVNNKGTTVRNVLKQISSSNSEYQGLANHLLNTADTNKLNTPIRSSAEEGRSNYSFGNRKISLQEEHANNIPIIMHEIAHAVTSNNLPMEFEGLRGEQLKLAMDKYIADPNSNPHVKELIQSYYETAKQMGVHDELFVDSGKGKQGKAPYVRGLAGNPDLSHEVIPHGYAMGDLHEFVAEAMNNSEFQNHLNELPSGLNDGKSLWSRLVSAIKNILGVNSKEGSMLERVLKPIDELIKSPRELTDSEKYDASKKFAPKEESKAAKEEKPSHLGWLGKGVRSMVDSVKDINHPGAKTVSDAIKKTLNEIPQRFGVTGNKVIEAGQRLNSEDKAQIKKIFDYENLHEKAAPAEMFTSNRQRDFYKIERQVYKESGEYRIKNNEPVLDNGKPRQLIQKEFAHPTTPNQQIVEVYKNGTDTNKIASLDKEFLDNLSKHGYSDSEAKKSLQQFKDSVQGDIKNTASNMQYYNAARRAQGIPLPDSFTRQDPVKNLEAYYHRQAVDNSFYKNIESDHKVLGLLGVDKDAWNNPVKRDPSGINLANNNAVKKALAEFHGSSGGPGEHNERALSSLTTTLFISNPALEVHKLASNIIGITNYADNPIQMGRILGAMIKNFGDGIQHAKENGILKLSAKSIGDAWDATATSAERMQSIGQSIRKLSSLGGLSDKLSNGLMQAGAEAVIPQKIEKANNGDKTSQALLTKLDPDYKIGKQYDKDGVSKLASTLSSYIHGTGDGRTMPAWMAADTEFSGFFKLAHWSIAQTNRFISDVYQPALKGNLTPLLTSLFGSAIGGYLIKDLREKIQGKHGQIPSLDEVANSEGGLQGHKSLVAYNMIAGAQYAGFGGLLSQLAKYPFDIAYKNNPQGATFPMDEIATDMASTLSDVSSAIANDKNINWAELASHVAGHVLSTDVQLSRVGINQAINNGLITGTVADKKLLSDKMGKLRRFEEIEGLPYEQQGEQAANPYMDLESKKFRTTQDLGEAVKMLPELVNKIVQENQSRPDVMMEKLKALKEHSYNTMPSMESMPISFMKYMGFLQKQEGPEAAQSALTDYLKHKAIGEAKAQMIP